MHSSKYFFSDCFFLGNALGLWVASRVGLLAVEALSLMSGPRNETPDGLMCAFDGALRELPDEEASESFEGCVKERNRSSRVPSVSGSRLSKSP